MSVSIIRGNALDLPLEDESVDLVVTSPPYFGLRSYQDGGEHYPGQIGSEATPTEFLDALIAATREMMRVTKPTGSIFVNLGDKYSGAPSGPQGSTGQLADVGYGDRIGGRRKVRHAIPNKSLIGIPWRYAIRCIDELGLILRAEIIWSKPNGLPESVQDRVRRSHEQWFHMVRSPRYFSAIDEIREEHLRTSWQDKAWREGRAIGGPKDDVRREENWAMVKGGPHALGKLPGSVWTIPTEPLTVPPELGVDHFAAFPMAWPRQLIRAFSPSGICTACGEGRRPVVRAEGMTPREALKAASANSRHGETGGQGLDWQGGHNVWRSFHRTGEYACACPTPTAPTTPATILDPFGGTGTTALVAHALGRHGISVDMSADYCRLAEWRTTDPGQRAKAAQVEKPPKQLKGQLGFDFEEESA